MQAVRIETKIKNDGNLILNELPFKPGESVEVIVLEQKKQESILANQYSLRGTPVNYQKPYLPVSEAKWEALN